MHWNRMAVSTRNNWLLWRRFGILACPVCPHVHPSCLLCVYSTSASPTLSMEAVPPLIVTLHSLHLCLFCAFNIVQMLARVTRSVWTSATATGIIVKDKDAPRPQQTKDIPQYYIQTLRPPSPIQQKSPNRLIVTPLWNLEYLELHKRLTVKWIDLRIG
ncbi:hypothetical protein IW262DRAFT_475883 [Armillaria fumosa]|nr:hypothetical protein IW262DRAFT_475883 [Armillaria fumosa]